MSVIICEFFIYLVEGEVPTPTQDLFSYTMAFIPKAEQIKLLFLFLESLFM